MKAHGAGCNAERKHLGLAAAGERKTGSEPADKEIYEFVSIAAAREYIKGAAATIASLMDRELLDVLERVDAAYRRYPELELERPRETWIEDLAPAVSLRAFAVLFRSRQAHWSAIKRVLSQVLREGQGDAIVNGISCVLPHIDGIDPSELGEMLQPILTDELPARQDSRALGKAVLSARRRLTAPAPVAHRQGVGAAVLQLAQRLRGLPPPANRNPYTAAAWGSGYISFSEFLSQFPCEVNIPSELGDRSFVCEAFRAIVLREPHATEIEQYMNLVREGISKSWIVQDIFASEEARSLDRRLRVLWNGHVITAPGDWADAQMPAIAVQAAPERRDI